MAQISASNQSSSQSGPPASASSQWVCLLAMVVFVSSVLLLKQQGFAKDINTLISLFIFVSVLIVIELFVRKVYRRPSTGLDVSWQRLVNELNIPRCLVKFLGFALTVGLLLFMYDTFPLYDKKFYMTWRNILAAIGPWLLFLIIPYVFIVDAWMKKPHDGYWEVGQLVLLRWRNRDWEIIKQHGLGWLIKGFFLPLMLAYLINSVNSFVNLPFEMPPTHIDWIVPAVHVVTRYAFMVDLAFVVVGYVMTCRLTDSHIRNVNPFLWGWVLCLIMYQPFWGMISRSYFKYDDGHKWFFWLHDIPGLLYIWGFIIIFFMLTWVWANLSFGLRFSNLTHRGIITNGPYRWTRHPSYLSKNISWWFLSMPFLSTVGPWEAIQHCILLVGVNCIYLWRAISEEQHLMQDADYVAYTRWIEEHGIFAWLRHKIPVLKYVTR